MSKGVLQALLLVCAVAGAAASAPRLPPPEAFGALDRGPDPLPRPVVAPPAAVAQQLPAPGPRTLPVDLAWLKGGGDEQAPPAVVSAGASGAPASVALPPLDLPSWNVTAKLSYETSETVYSLADRCTKLGGGSQGTVLTCALPAAPLTACRQPCPATCPLCRPLFGSNTNQTAGPFVVRFGWRTTHRFTHVPGEPSSALRARAWPVQPHLLPPAPLLA